MVLPWSREMKEANQMMWPNSWSCQSVSVGLKIMTLYLFCHYFQLREEKLQEEKTSEDLIHKFILDDMDVGKRKMEEQQKKDESVVLKGNQECVSKLMLLLPARIPKFSFFGFPGFLDWVLIVHEGYELAIKILANENCIPRSVRIADVLLEVSVPLFVLPYVTLPNTADPLSFGDLLGLQPCVHFHEHFSVNPLQYNWSSTHSSCWLLPISHFIWEALQEMLLKFPCDRLSHGGWVTNIL